MIRAATIFFVVGLNAFAPGLYILAASLGFSTNVRADNSVSQNIETGKFEVVEGEMRNFRKVTGETCRLINGKGACLENKYPRSVRYMWDSAKTKAEEQKNKTE